MILQLHCMIVLFLINMFYYVILFSIEYCNHAMIHHTMTYFGNSIDS